MTLNEIYEDVCVVLGCYTQLLITYSFTVQRLFQYTDGKARRFLVDDFSDKRNVFTA